MLSWAGLLPATILAQPAKPMTLNTYTTVATPTPPVTKKIPVQDNYHGTVVNDPYRWLENDTSRETAAWVAAENQYTNAVLNTLPNRQGIHDQLTKAWNYPRYSAPSRHGEYYYFFKNDGLQNQSVLYRQKGLDGAAEVFIDPNSFSADGTVSLAGIEFNKDNTQAAYWISRAGSDWNEIYIMDVATKQLLADKINWVKFSGVAWSGKGFFYSRYDEPVAGTELSNQNRNQKVYYHAMGTAQAKDQLIYSDAQHPLRYLSAAVSEDEQFLYIYGSEGTQGTEIHFKRLKNNDAKFHLLVPGFEHNYGVIDNDGDRILLLTDNGAPNYHVIEIDAALAEQHNGVQPNGVFSRILIPEKSEVLEGVNTACGKLFAVYLQDASSRVFQYNYAGKMENQVVLPGIGTAGGFSGKKTDKEVFYSFTSYIDPNTIYRYIPSTGISSMFRQTEIPGYDASQYQVSEVFYPSKDGTQVHMFLVHRRNMQKNGANPVYLYGYGGFNISLTPSFAPNRIPFLAKGGIIAVANLRGGGEYGEKWHKAGMLDQKQHVFDDFIGAAEYLIKEKYTDSRHIAIAGGSNGGLLVGACMTQRPDLFRVALPAVGVMDMLRFHKFTVGWGWVVEYGSSDNAEQFKTPLPVLSAAQYQTRSNLPGYAHYHRRP